MPVNRSSEPAAVAFVLLDSKPLGIGHPIVRGEKASLSVHSVHATLSVVMGGLDPRIHLPAK